jgi:hypothetical protein
MMCFLGTLVTVQQMDDLRNLSLSLGEWDMDDDTHSRGEVRMNFDPELTTLSRR